MMKTTLSFWSSYFRELPFEEAVESFMQHDIHAVELSSEHGKELMGRDGDYLKTAKQIRAFLHKKSFTVTQGHLPLHFKIATDREKALPEVLRYIDFYEAIGVKNLVLHCDRLYAFPEMGKAERFHENIISLSVIAEHIKNKDIYICLENLRQPNAYPAREPLPLGHAEDLLKLIEATGSDRFAICLDTGHLNLVADPDQAHFIRTAGKHLRALHIADNQNLDNLDEHLMPFGRGKVDFFAVVKALREIDYEGMFNFEVPGESQCPIPIRHAKLEYIKCCYDYLMTAEME